MPNLTRVLIVDDSPTMRRLVRSGIEADPCIQVVAEAGSAREARDLVKALNPDVMTLDIEMPGMDGLDFLARLMRARPMPVIMLSSLTSNGSEAALRALSLGAVDCIEKPKFGEATRKMAELAELIRNVSNSGLSWPRRAPAPVNGAAGSHPFAWNGKWILIGSSTGGVEALETILRGFPIDCPPTLITQHMPEQFLVAFAARLDAAVAPKVRIAREGDVPRPGQVLIAPGGETHLRIAPDDARVILDTGPKISGHRPSVDALMMSAVPHGPHIVAAILTGMGRDGAEGMQKLRQAGAVCLGQDEESCIVYGMPRVAKELGGTEREVPLVEMSSALLKEATK